MSVWKGSVDVPYVGGTTCTLSDLHFSHDTPPTSSIAAHLKTFLTPHALSFIRYVPPSRIPYFLAVAPPLNVTTTSPQTCDFLRTLFLSALPKRDDIDAEQSRIALLLAVNSDDQGESNDWGITQLLIYAAVSHPPAPSNITPPLSSPDPPPPPVLSVHALPLSTRHDLAKWVPVKPEPGREDHARYVAPNPQDVLSPFISRVTKKRRADALDRIVAKRQKSVGGGGLPSPTEEAGGQEEMLGGAGGWESARAPMARTQSMGGMSDLSRPRSSASTKSMTRPTAVVKPEVMPERGEVESKNREVLKKVVVEEMRRRGMKDYRAKSTVPQGEEGDGEEEARRKEEEREEFKKVYHETLRAAVFALRKSMFTEVLVKPDGVRRVVEGLLDVFLPA